MPTDLRSTDDLHSTDALRPHDELRRTRELIDDLDRDLVELLAMRADLARRAALAKAEIGVAIRDSAREQEFLRERRTWAEERGLDAAAVEEIFRAVLRFSRSVQEEEPPEQD